MDNDEEFEFLCSYIITLTYKNVIKEDDEVLEIVCPVYFDAIDKTMNKDHI